MSTRNLSLKYDMPANPVFLDFPRTDADLEKSTWPSNTSEVIDNAGAVNFYHPIPELVGASLKWKHQVAMKVAEKLGMAGGCNYVFKTWPEGYGFFDHHKGPKSKPRHDAYLIGSKFVNRFRSVPEFTPHAIWLMTDPTMNRTNCECKYCVGAPQRMISQKFGFKALDASPSSVLQAGRPRRARAPRERVQPLAMVQKIKKPIRHHSPPKQIAVHERYADVEALSMVLGPERDMRRFFREGELIWCALNPPIRGTEGQFIHFWPGIVKSFSTKVESLPREDHGENPASKPPPPPVVPEQSTYYVDQDVPPYRVIQRTLYRAQLLCVAHDYLVRDDECLPYPAYIPSMETVHAMRSVHVNPDTLDRNALAAFNPCPPDAHSWDAERTHAHFLDAVPPYFHAIQAASALAAFWTPTDEFTYEIEVPSVPGPSEPSTATPAAVLNGNDAIQKALSEIHSTLVGPQPIPGTKFKQERYQGLWWGAERIWTDELVRLKPARKQIAPAGAEHILPPSGPSRAVMESFGLGEDATPEQKSDLGAGERGVFMRLTSLFPVDSKDEDGQDRVDVLASGALYELADEGWEEPGPTPSAPPVMVPPATPSRPRARSSDPTRSPSKMSTGVPFMSPPGPSQPTLISPDPSVPVPETVAVVLDAITAPIATRASSNPVASTPAPSQAAVHVQLSGTDSQGSGPLHDYPLPPPPPGFKFRPILTPGYEVVISLTLVSGRYYPGLLRHPLLLPLHAQMEEAAAHDEHVPQECESVLALEGLRAGFSNAMDPYRWERARNQMVTGSEEESWVEVTRAWGKSTNDVKDEGVGGNVNVDRDGDVDMDRPLTPLQSPSTTQVAGPSSGVMAHI